MKVAVIGAGPAGMTAAYALANLGPFEAARCLASYGQEEAVITSTGLSVSSSQEARPDRAAA